LGREVRGLSKKRQVAWAWAWACLCGRALGAVARGSAPRWCCSTRMA
jgi:hypothetical protein